MKILSAPFLHIFNFFVLTYRLLNGIIYHVNHLKGILIMEYPVYFKRKRLGTVIFNAFMLVVSVTATVWNVLSQRDFLVFAVASGLFLLTLVFNIYLASEKTFAVYSDRIVCLSRFLPKVEISAKDLSGVEYASAMKDVLKINYNTDEFDLEKLSGGSAAFAELGEGMWTAYISKKDVDRPLSEVKYIIESIKK